MFEPREIPAPYPGLRPFMQHESAIFFGRDQHIERLLDILRQERFLAVIGPSGSGKSSLVRAGLLPALMAGWTGSGGNWRIAFMRPGDRPMRQLARALVDPAALGGELSPGISLAAAEAEAAAPIEAELRRGPLGLVDLVTDVQRRSSRPFDLLVLVDQFEEIFRYTDLGSMQAEESDAFVNVLLESCKVEGRIYIAIAMRSDFLGNCVAFLDLPDAINRGQYLTPRLTRDQLAAAITEPARVFGGAVEAELVNDLINATSRDPDQLPILQHALARMWESAIARDDRTPYLTRADLSATGGIERALSRHADSVFDGLGPLEQTTAEELFRSITEGGSEKSGRDTRRPQKLGDIATATKRPWQQYIPAIEAFSREGVNFLSYVTPLNDESLIDISHEALIRQWRRLQTWVADEFERADDYRRWRDRAIERDKGGELLTGADLARAREWLQGSTRTGAVAAHWEPTREWAERYASAAEGGQDEFARTVAFIDQSEARERERAQAVERAENESRERERQRLEAEARAAEAIAEAERTAARLAQKRVEDLEKVIAQIPDEAKRQALKKRYLPDSVKRLSKREEKQLAAKLKSGELSGKARARMPPQFGLKLWENGTILRVRFMAGTPVQHKKVRAAASAWMQYANVQFHFVSDPDAEVRVAFDRNGGSWAYIGPDALAVPKDQPTMNLGWLEENVLHEFGHVLGLIHETNNPNVDLPWNKPAVYRDLQGPPNFWSKQQVDEVMFKKYDGLEYRAFDPQSIMSYPFPAAWFLDGRAIAGGKVLSKSDKEFIRKLYPRSR